jgi:homoserine O-succinyltransferase/O-acetyltransferase
MFASSLNTMIRIAILDLYNGQQNQGMRCLREILHHWSKQHGITIQLDEFNVRLHQQVPDTSYHIYISSGGPGSPLESKGSNWENVYLKWLEKIENWNNDPRKEIKKFVFFICHSYEIVCRHYNLGTISKRKSTAFGVFPVHMMPDGKEEIVFEGLNDPFYVVDSRDWQLTGPNHEKLDLMGAKILCVEKDRPHVPYERAVMGIRFNEYMIGTQFHPEADAKGMSLYLKTEEKKKTVIANHGEEKWKSMLEGLGDPDKIMFTYAHIIPNFLNTALQQLQPELA